MRSKIFAVVLCLPAFAAAAQRVDVTTSEKADFAPGGTLRIEGATGDVNIEGWDQPVVQIEVVRSAWTDHADAAKARLNLIHVTRKTEGSVMTVETAHKRFSGGQISYRIHVPSKTKLVVHNGIGAVVIYGVEESIEAESKTGDVVVQLREPARYRIEASTKLGSIYSDFEGKVLRHRMGMGESLSPEVEGPGEPRRITLRVGTGGISIQKVAA